MLVDRDHAVPDFDAVDAVRKAYLDTGKLPDAATVSKWTTYEYVHFIEGLPQTMKPEQLAWAKGKVEELAALAVGRGWGSGPRRKRLNGDGGLLESALAIIAVSSWYS